MKWKDSISRIFHNKLIICLLVFLLLAFLIISGIKVVEYASDKNFQKELAEGGNEPLLVDKTAPEITPGRYYLNGDVNSYYFEIYDDTTLELCCDDMYSLFETWNPGNDDVIKEDVEYWTGRRPYNVIVTELGTVMLAVEWEYDENGELTGLTSGSCLLDDNTLGNWGNQGDFIRVDVEENSADDAA